MKPLRVAGLLLVAVGIAIVALRGVSFTRERHSVEVGNVELAAERKSFIPPVVGVLVMLAGAAMLLVPARKG